MNKKHLLALMVGLLALLPATVATASGSYFSAVTNLNPAGYWPMHEVEAAAPGDIETNYGTLGLLGTGFYPDWALAYTGASNQLVIQHQVPGALTNGGDSDTATYFYPQGAINGSINALYVPLTSPSTVLHPPFSVECWYNAMNFNPNDIWSEAGDEGLNAGASGANTGTNISGIRLAWGGANSGYILYSYYNSGTQNNLFKSVDGYPSSGVVPSPSNVWDYVVITCDAQTNLSIYTNGSFGGTVAAVKKYTPDYWTPFEVGDGRGNTRAGQGAADEVAVYPTNLPAGTISAHYAAGISSNPNPTYFQAVTNDHPVIYLRMDGPAYTAPGVGTWPVLTNYGSVAVNGVYTPGTMPGIATGPVSPGGVPFGGLAVASGTNVPQLSGVSSFADAGYAAAYDPVGATPFSVTAMFRGNPADGRVQTIIGHSDNSWQIYMNTTGNLQCQLGTNTTSQLTSAKVYNDGNWHQVVEVYTPNSNPSLAGTNALYVDGVLASLTNGVATGGILPGTNADVMIGGNPEYTNNPAGVGRQFSGQVCEAAVFTNALSASQVVALYNSSGVSVTITTQPFSTNVNQSAVFTNDAVAASGSSLAYQWYENGAARAGQTNANLILNSVQPSDASTNWYVVVTNLYSSVTSAVVSVTVFSAPTVIQNLASTNLILFAGGSAGLSIAAAGAPPLYYQWYSNSVNIVNATNVGYTLTNAQPPNATNTFYCIITNTAGTATSLVATVTILPAPAASYPQAIIADNPLGYWRLNEGPDDANGNQGVTAHDYWGGNNGVYSNTVLANPGYNPNDTNETAPQFGYFALADCDVYAIPTNVDFSATNSSRAFSVECWANGYNQVSDAGIVTKGYSGAEQFNLDCGSDTISTNNPVAHSFRFFVRTAAGATAGVSSDVNPVYGVWHHLVGVCDEPNGVVSFYIDGLLAGTNTITPGSGILASTYPMNIGSRAANSTTNNNLQFSGFIDDVSVYNYALSSNQVVAHYAAGQVPAHIAVQPADMYASKNGNATFSATASGTPPIGYQWYDVNTSSPVSNGATIGGSTNATLVLANVQASDSYYLQVTNLYGTNVSTAANLNVVAGQPQFYANLQPQYYVMVGGTISLPVTAYGTLPMTNQWQKSDTNAVSWTNLVDNGRITGSQSNVLTIANAQPGDAGDYQLAITNSGGPNVSAVANLIVGTLPITFNGVGLGWTSNTRGNYTQPAITNGVMTLTGGASNYNEGRSIFFLSPQYIGAFQASFTYQDVDLGGADGIAFILQNDPRGVAALGGTPGTGLGVNGITPSFELDLAIVTIVGYAVNTNGNSTAVQAMGGVNLKSGNPIAVTVAYANGQLALTFMDTVTSNLFSTNLVVGDLTGVLGANTALIGFSGATGQAQSSLETISNFTFVSIPPQAIQLNGTNALITWPLSVSGYTLQQNGNLATTNWVTATATDNPSNNLHQVAIPMTGSNLFYRLILQ